MSAKIAHVVPVRDFPTTASGFDYLVPDSTEQEVGQLCQVNFRNTDTLGLIIELKNESDFLNLKTLVPLETKIVFNLCWLKSLRWFSNYYNYSLGSTLKLFFPKFGKKLSLVATKINNKKPLNKNKEVFDKINLDPKKGIIFHADSHKTIKDFYLHLAEVFTKENKDLLIICPDQNAIKEIFTFLQGYNIINLDASLTDKYWRENWLATLTDDSKIVLTTQKGVITPVKNLGAIIVDQENSSGQIQRERNPRYDCRVVAKNYAKNLQVPIVFTTISPSLFSLNLVKQKSFDYYSVKLNKRNQFTVIDQNSEQIASKNILGPICEQAIKDNLTTKKPTFIFSFYHQPKSAHCLFCDKENSIDQTYCTNCHQLLIADKKSLIGIKDELLKLGLSAESADDYKQDNGIYIGGLKHLSLINNPGLTIIIDADNILNIPQFESAEKLRGIIDLLNSKSDKLLIISKNCYHHCYSSDFMRFVKTEIEIRKKYHYPPFGSVFHISSPSFVNPEIRAFKTAVFTKYLEEGLKIDGPFKDKLNKNEYLIIKVASDNTLANINNFMYSNWMLDRHPADLLK